MNTILIPVYLVVDPLAATGNAARLPGGGGAEAHSILTSILVTARHAGLRRSA